MRILCTLLLLCLPMLAHAQPGDDLERQQLVQGNSEFAMNLYQRLAEEEKGKNLFFSPYSISNALAMTYAGARGDTAKQMKETLRFPREDVHVPFRTLIRQTQAEGKAPPFELTIANRLWGQKNYGFLPDFVKTSADFYFAGLEEVDFRNDIEGTRKTINSWVEKKTKDKIKDLIPNGVLDQETVLVLTNAIYFKASWASQFDPHQTKPGAFHRADGKAVQVPMMQLKQTMGFADHKTFTLLEMPYVKRDQSMIVILPKDKGDLSIIEKNLTAPNLSAWLAKLGQYDVDVKLPKFKVTAQFDLKRALMSMGMKDAFTPRKADFSGMASGAKLHIGAALHKAFVAVDEAGTEAAAATAIGIRFSVSLPTATFHADRPFLFLIRDQRTESILFLGRVVDPS